MHGTGLTVDEPTRAEFARLTGDPSTLYVKFQISDESFVLRGSGKISSSRESDFLEMQRSLDNQPAFIVGRARGGAEDKWMMIFYMPDGASVKDRMVYAASTAALRQGLGQALFLPNVYAISTKSELTLSSYEGASQNLDVKTLMTREERLKEDSEVASIMSMGSVKVSAIVGLPVKADPEAIQAIQQIAAHKEGQSAINTGVFAMHSEQEILIVDKSGSYSLDDIPKLVPATEPRYVLHSFQHENAQGEPAHAFIFVYYCPDKIKPKLKMFYSTCKSVVMAISEKLGAPVTKSLEVSDPKEVSVKGTIEELYPKVAEKKMFKKPTKTGKGPAKFLGSGFKSPTSPTSPSD